MPRRRDSSGGGSRKEPSPGLGAYRAKRRAEATPEPFGRDAPRPGLFAVQQHAARRMHYDLRLEWGGVLLSWAVPKGPSIDPAQKRLAVRVEDHPVEYADFEGSIPEGNYGAGAVILWDLGRWAPLEDPDAALEAGALHFELFGHKLRGRFVLARTKRGEWLWIKKADAWAGDDADLDPHSVHSGLTIEERRDGAPRLEALARRIARARPPRAALDPAALRPMLAEPLDAPFSRAGWIFEPKYDGYRVLAHLADGAVELRTRNGRPIAERFPEIARGLAALPFGRLVLDGEVVASDAEGRPSFSRLQQRAALRRAREIERAAVVAPLQYFAFDLLGFEGLDLRGQPLVRRKEWLDALLPPRGPVRAGLWLEERGEDLHEQVVARGLEGLVAKRADSTYRSGRWADWRKLRLQRSDDFAIVGFTAPRGGRPGFGALHLATHRGGELVYAGRVGSGFRDAELDALRARLEPLRRDTPACAGALPQTRGHTWVEPRLVGEVRFTEVTPDGQLRHPTWLGLREDKTPEECVAEDARPEPDDENLAPEIETAPPPAGDEREVALTNLDKVFFPDDGLSKGDLVDYYRQVAPWLLPYLRGRPLVLTRYPDGIGGKSFFQKDSPEWAPDFVRTERIWSEQARREVNYFVCDDLASLLYVVNLGTIPLHVWASRVDDLPHPDWCILDLDPKGAPFAHVVALARELRALCEEHGLPAFPKTSGASGLHVLLPLGGQLRYDQCRMLAELLARWLVARRPEIATIARRVQSRQGKVYVDFLQNGHGRLLVAPFSVRPLPGAPVSMPLRWREVNARLDPRRFTVRNARTRLRRLGGDPLAAVLGPAPDWERALARLAESL